MGLSLECGSNTIMLVTQEVKVRAELLQCKIDEIGQELANYCIGLARRAGNIPGSPIALLHYDDYAISLNACAEDLEKELKDIQDNGVELYHYPVKGTLVTTPNMKYARIKARRIMQRSLVLNVLPVEKLIRRRSKK